MANVPSVEYKTLSHSEETWVTSSSSDWPLTYKNELIVKVARFIKLFSITTRCTQTDVLSRPTTQANACKSVIQEFILAQVLLRIPPLLA